MQIQLELSKRAQQNYAAYPKTFRNTCALSKANETVQPARQHGNYSKPKKRHGKPEKTKYPKTDE